MTKDILSWSKGPAVEGRYKTQPFNSTQWTSICSETESSLKERDHQKKKKIIPFSLVILPWKNKVGQV